MNKGIFASILRTFGLAPFSALIQAESEIISHKGTINSVRDALRLANEQVAKLTGEVNSHASMRKTLANDLSAARREINTLLDDRLTPRLWVRDDGKTLKLELTRPCKPDTTVVLKTMVKNKANDKAMLALSAEANALFNFPAVNQPTKPASPPEYA